MALQPVTATKYAIRRNADCLWRPLIGNATDNSHAIRNTENCGQPLQAIDWPCNRQGSRITQYRETQTTYGGHQLAMQLTNVTQCSIQQNVNHLWRPSIGHATDNSHTIRNTENFGLPVDAANWLCNRQLSQDTQYREMRTSCGGHRLAMQMIAVMRYSIQRTVDYWWRPLIGCATKNSHLKVNNTKHVLPCGAKLVSGVMATLRCGGESEFLTSRSAAAPDSDSIKAPS